MDDTHLLYLRLLDLFLDLNGFLRFLERGNGLLSLGLDILLCKFDCYLEFILILLLLLDDSVLDFFLFFGQLLVLHLALSLIANFQE